MLAADGLSQQSRRGNLPRLSRQYQASLASNGPFVMPMQRRRQLSGTGKAEQCSNSPDTSSSNLDQRGRWSRNLSRATTSAVNIRWQGAFQIAWFDSAIHKDRPKRLTKSASLTTSRVPTASFDSSDAIQGHLPFDDFSIVHLRPNDFPKAFTTFDPEEVSENAPAILPRLCTPDGANGFQKQDIPIPQRSSQCGLRTHESNPQKQGQKQGQIVMPFNPTDRIHQCRLQFVSYVRTSRGVRWNRAQHSDAKSPYSQADTFFKSRRICPGKEFCRPRA